MSWINFRGTFNRHKHSYAFVNFNQIITNQIIQKRAIISIFMNSFLPRNIKFLQSEILFLYFCN